MMSLWNVFSYIHHLVTVTVFFFLCLLGKAQHMCHTASLFCGCFFLSWLIFCQKALPSGPFWSLLVCLLVTSWIIILKPPPHTHTASSVWYWPSGRHSIGRAQKHSGDHCYDSMLFLWPCLAPKSHQLPANCPVVCSIGFEVYQFNWIGFFQGIIWGHCLFFSDPRKASSCPTTTTILTCNAI